MKTCNFFKTISIGEPNVTFSTVSEDYRGIDLSFNKLIYFLPIELNRTFPDLVYYQASYCSISKVSPENFQGLDKLLELHLFDNKIERIEPETFKDLISLDSLNLSKIILGFEFAFLISAFFRRQSNQIYCRRSLQKFQRFKKTSS